MRVLQSNNCIIHSFIHSQIYLKITMGQTLPEEKIIKTDMVSALMGLTI